jgi:hypothetical protein
MLCAHLAALFTITRYTQDPYAVICSKLWKKLGERDWRTIAKALYTLHRLLRSKTGSSSSCSSASSSGAVTTDVALTATASAASRVFASAFTAHLQARAAKADSLAEQIQLRAGIQASWLKVYKQYTRCFAVGDVLVSAAQYLHNSL